MLVVFNRKLSKNNYKFNYQNCRKTAVVIVCICLLFIGGCSDSERLEQQGITKITFWHGINPPENRDIFQELVTKFNQDNADIEVEALYIGQPDAQLPKILAATVSGQPPDILWYVAQITGKLNQLGALLPLEDWLDNSPIKAEIDPAMFNSMRLNGHILSIPFATNNAAVFYRPSLFAQAGVKSTPQNWAELKAVASKLTQDTNNDNRPDKHGIFLSLGKGEWTVFAWLPFIYSAGGDLLKEGKPNLVNDGAIAALQLGSDLVKDGVAILSPPERGYEIDDFIEGKVAMQITGPWTLAQLKTTDIDYGVFPIPVAQQPAAVIGGENLFVFKTTSQKTTG